VSCFENVRHIHKVTQHANALIRFAYPSICPHVSTLGSTVKDLCGILWWKPLSTCQENPDCVKIGQKFQALYKKT